MVFHRIKSHYQKVKGFYQRYERFFFPALIIWGFFYHYITFKIIPIDEVLYLVFGYLALAIATILFVHFYDAGKISPRLRYVRLFIPLLLQFSIGSIIGGVFIFYWFSGSIFISWPFIVVVVLLIISIEAFKHHLEKPVVQFSLFNFACILLLAVALPYYFDSLSPWLFVTAGIISLLLVAALAQFLARYSEEIKKKEFSILGFSFLVCVIMGVFYFYNLIPPVPLSIRDAGVYHSVKRTGSNYAIQTEHESFWQKLKPGQTIHLGPNERAFVYTSIYTPTDLNINIFHDWQYYDPNQKHWVSQSKVSFPITGGRQNGYRGYSLKTNLAAGTWRVLVETPRGQVLGRFKFNVEKVTDPPKLETINK